MQGASGGSGYMLGSKNDNLNANYARDFGRNWSTSVTGSYMHSSELIGYCLIAGTSSPCLLDINYTPTTNAVFGGVQASRKLGRYLNIFASYTAIDQSSNLLAQLTLQNQHASHNTNVLNGMYQVISFGIGYSPREKQLKK
jgi:hypothetical protein